LLLLVVVLIKDINLKESKSMQNLICHRTMSDRTCLRLVKTFWFTCHKDR